MKTAGPCSHSGLLNIKKDLVTGWSKSSELTICYSPALVPDSNDPWPAHTPGVLEGFLIAVE